MAMLVFKIVYWLGLIVEIIERAPFQKMYQASAKVDRRGSRTEQILVGLLLVGTGLFPLIYTFTNWLDFANYSLPPWLGWVGVIVFAFALVVFGRGHVDLKANWSPTLEIRAAHTLVTDGIYGYIRHPMYASQWLWSIAQILLLQNWLAGPIGLLITIPFYFLRVGPEEKMMLDTFGDQYRQYMNKVGGLFPK
jgi:protein-S-isoprenylcysteine O-methyltransferase Ste14